MREPRLLVDEEKLRLLYTVQGQSLKNIANELGVSPTTISRNLRHYCIAPRGETPICRTYKTREEAVAAIRKAHKKIGDPFTKKRYGEYIGQPIAYIHTAIREFGWRSMLQELGITIATRGEDYYAKNPKMSGGETATLSAAKPPRPRSFSPRLLNHDRSTVKGFQKYMLVNPIYFTDLTRLPCTEENVEAVCRRYKAAGLLIGRVSGLRTNEGRRGREGHIYESA